MPLKPAYVRQEKIGLGDLLREPRLSKITRDTAEAVTAESRPRQSRPSRYGPEWLARQKRKIDGLLIKDLSGGVPPTNGRR
jgi:hypothetical protein